jgi:hypothetical protein
MLWLSTHMTATGHEAGYKRPKIAFDGLQVSSCRERHDLPSLACRLP